MVARKTGGNKQNHTTSIFHSPYAKESPSQPHPHTPIVRGQSKISSTPTSSRVHPSLYSSTVHIFPHHYMRQKRYRVVVYQKDALNAAKESRIPAYRVVGIYHALQTRLPHLASRYSPDNVLRVNLVEERVYCTWLTISFARDRDSTICWHSFLLRTV